MSKQHVSLVAVQNFFVLLLFVIIYGTSEVNGQMVVSSPEPAEWAGDGLYLYKAGFSTEVISPLRNGMTICIDDYPTGINIRCIGASVTAKFFVNAIRIRTEYRAPFFLKGDVRGLVREWKNPPRTALIRCKLNGPLRNFRATVHFKC